MTAEPVPLLVELYGLAGRTAIVTGASKGLGADFAEVLHAAGANVVPVARTLSHLKERFGGRERFLPLRCDITDPIERADVVQKAIDAFGSIDVLVNSAAITGPDTGHVDPVVAFEKVLEVDLLALYAMCLLVAEPMREQRSGSIINISSMSGMVAVAPLDDHAYCAAKGAVVNLTRQLGTRWIAEGIRVNSIAPGMFRTEMSAVTLSTDGSARLVQDECPIGRLGEVRELASALLFLAGSGASYVTGHTLLVDGGFTAR